MITYKKGNLIQAFENGEVDVIFHQENCTGDGIYSGFAGAIAKQYPKWVEHTVDYSEAALEFKSIAGSVSMFHLNQTQTIVNCYSQYYKGSPSDKTYVKGFDNKIVKDNFENRLFDLGNCLKHIAAMSNRKRIACPLIASALGSCKTRKKGLTDLEYFIKYIAPTVEEFLKDFNVIVYYL